MPRKMVSGWWEKRLTGFELDTAAGAISVDSFLEMPIPHHEVIKKKPIQDHRSRAERSRELSMKHSNWKRDREIDRAERSRPDFTPRNWRGLDIFSMWEKKSLWDGVKPGEKEQLCTASSTASPSSQPVRPQGPRLMVRQLIVWVMNCLITDHAQRYPMLCLVQEEMRTTPPQTRTREAASFTPAVVLYMFCL